MSKKGKRFFFILFLLSISGCLDPNVGKDSGKNQLKSFEGEIKKASASVIDYEETYSMIEDTVKNWVVNELLFDKKYLVPHYKIDSLFCVSKKADKIIGIMYSWRDTTDASDGMREFMGAKINRKWYFWNGGYTPLVREGIKGHDPRKPLSYKQLHQTAIGSLSGYLNKKGNIKDEWFDTKFSGDGWPSFNRRYDYKYILDGRKIDDEKEYWDYIWKKKGLMLWHRKAYQDSIAGLKK